MIGKNAVYTAVGKTGSEPNDGVLTIQQNGETVGTFSANQATDETINIAGGSSDVFVVTVTNNQIDCEYQELVDAINAGKVINVIDDGVCYTSSSSLVAPTNILLFSLKESVESGVYSTIVIRRYIIQPNSFARATFNRISFSGQSNNNKPTATQYVTDTNLQTKITNSQLSKGFIYFTTDTNKVYLATDTNTVQELTQVQADWNQTDTTAVDYIKNKPTIETPVQADWNETTTTELSYIQNKPDLGTVFIAPDLSDFIKTVINADGTIDISLDVPFNVTELNSKLGYYWNGGNLVYRYLQRVNVGGFYLDNNNTYKDFSGGDLVNGSQFMTRTITTTQLSNVPTNGDIYFIFNFIPTNYTGTTQHQINNTVKIIKLTYTIPT